MGNIVPVSSLLDVIPSKCKGRASPQWQLQPISHQLVRVKGRVCDLGLSSSVFVPTGRSAVISSVQVVRMRQGNVMHVRCGHVGSALCIAGATFQHFSGQALDHGLSEHTRGLNCGKFMMHLSRCKFLAQDSFRCTPELALLSSDCSLGDATSS